MNTTIKFDNLDIDLTYIIEGHGEDSFCTILTATIAGNVALNGKTGQGTIDILDWLSEDQLEEIEDRAWEDHAKQNRENLESDNDY